MYEGFNDQKENKQRGPLFSRSWQKPAKTVNLNYFLALHCIEIESINRPFFKMEAKLLKLFSVVT
jgi:hypothetical protein